jgi:hypothetical protein
MVRILVFALVVACGESFTSSAADAQGPATTFRTEMLTQPVFPSWCGPTFSALCEPGSVPECSRVRECYYFGQRVVECVAWLCKDVTGRGLDTFPHGRRAPGAGRLRTSPRIGDPRDPREIAEGLKRRRTP